MTLKTSLEQTQKIKIKFVGYSSPDTHRCYFVYLLNKVYQKLPPCAVEKDAFHLHPKRSVPPPGSPWYDNMFVGKEKLRTYLESMCKEAGITEKKDESQLKGYWLIDIV